ncbi:MAG TPA: hypothetical protein PKV73_09680 [Agriterribacter sp.]|nr:hypothetical protein [Chitinophagaceae bacterium]HRP32152.1 hypothetical protein [Agriterribacter sp.]
MNEYTVLISALASITVVSITSIITLVLNKKTHKQSLSKELYYRKINIYEEAVASRELIVETLDTIYFTLTEIFNANEEDLESLNVTLNSLNIRFQKEYEENRRIVNKSLLYLDWKIDDIHHALFILNVVRSISAGLASYLPQKFTDSEPSNRISLENEIKESLSLFNGRLIQIRELNNKQINKMRVDLNMASL